MEIAELYQKGLELDAEAERLEEKICSALRLKSAAVVMPIRFSTPAASRVRSKSLNTEKLIPAP